MKQKRAIFSIRFHADPLLKFIHSLYQKVRYNHDSAVLALYNAYLSSPGLALKQLLYIQII